MQKKKHSLRSLYGIGMICAVCGLVLTGCGKTEGKPTENGKDLVTDAIPTTTPKPTATPTPTLMPEETADARLAAVNKLMIGDVTPETIRDYSVLPVLELTVENKIGNNYEAGTMVLSDLAGTTLYEGGLEIKLRGNSTRQ